MAHDSIIERINGESFVTGAYAPFFLDDPETVYYVREGHLDLFSVETTPGQHHPVGRWPFVAGFPEGTMVFGSPEPPPNPHLTRNVFRFFAVPSRDAVLVRGRRSAISTLESFDLDATVWIDEWIGRLSEFLGKALGPPPTSARLLEAEPEVPYSAGEALTAQHFDVIWVTANRPLRVIGLEELGVPAGAPPLAVTERTWLELDTDLRVTGAYTPTVFLKEQIWPALDAFNILVQKYSALAWMAKGHSLEERHRSSLIARQTSAARMFGRLGDVLGTHATAPAAERLRTPLQSAAAIVAERIGARIESRGAVRESADPVETLVRFVRPSGIRTRRLALTEDWWRRVGPSFVGTAADDGRPLAVVSNDGYRVVDPGTGDSFAVRGRKEAERVERQGLMLYAPLPRRITSGLAAMAHAFGGFWRDLRIVLAMACIGGLLALLTPILTGQLLAETIPRVDTPMWTAYLAALLLGAVGTAAFEIVRSLALLRIESRVDEGLQAAVWSRLLSLPTAFFRRYTVGDLADRANGVSQIRMLMSGTVAGAIISGVFSLFSFALLFYYSWRLALCAVGLVLFMVAVTWLFARGQIKHHRDAFHIQGMIDGFVYQIISGVSKLRMANAENFALARWAERFSRQKRSTLSARRWGAAQITVNGAFAPLSSLVIFAFVATQLLEVGSGSAFGLADFLSFNAAFGQFVAAITALTGALTTAVNTIPLLERVQPILEAEPEMAEGGVDPGDLAGEVEFANVFFRYLPEVPNAVDGVSFRIRPGDFVAFVGPSGSGKSSIYRLMLGFERPTSGSVFVDGQNMTTLDLTAVRSRMGVVLQNGQLSAASIFENIAGASQLTMDEAWDAVRSAGLEEDIRAMPMGMHTMLPEGGGGLSGGQKQRLLIARALARKPRIILFDEATSALDNCTQAIVRNSLRNLSATRVVAAHRLTTIWDADIIYVMEKGRIVESGRYDELMRRGGLFARLAQRQLV